MLTVSSFVFNSVLNVVILNEYVSHVMITCDYCMLFVVVIYSGCS